MEINRKLNLVIPVERSDGRLYVHSMPIARAVFERYHLVIAKAFATIYAHGLGDLAGPRTAALVLRDTAQALGVWEGDTGVERGLFAEIRRLTNVISPGANGWEQIPFQEALNRKVLDEDELSEVENAIAFFILASSMHRRTELRTVLDGAAILWGAHIDSSPFTEFIASLPTSTPAASSGPKPTPSSIPA